MMARVVPSEVAGIPEAEIMPVSTPAAKPIEESEDTCNGAIPLLENGDRLTRAEFERRYHAMPNLKKAELIEGVVFMPSPVRYERHSHPHTRLVTWLGIYETDTPGVEAGDNGSIRLDLDNEPQPDAFLIIRPERGGQVRISEDDYIEGAPELVAEVAASSVSYDLGKKFDVYRRNGVLEYVVWRVLDRQVDWFVNRGGRFEPMLPAADGILRSSVFPGLWLDPAALVGGDKATVKAILEQGMNSPEHADFVAKLEKAGTA
jgi:Uma2 family endonuclease